MLDLNAFSVVSQKAKVSRNGSEEELMAKEAGGGAQ